MANVSAAELVKVNVELGVAEALVNGPVPICQIVQLAVQLQAAALTLVQDAQVAAVQAQQIANNITASIGNPAVGIQVLAKAALAEAQQAINDEYDAAMVQLLGLCTGGG